MCENYFSRLVKSVRGKVIGFPVARARTHTPLGRVGNMFISLHTITIPEHTSYGRVRRLIYLTILARARAAAISLDTFIYTDLYNPRTFSSSSFMGSNDFSLDS